MLKLSTAEPSRGATQRKRVHLVMLDGGGRDGLAGTALAHGTQGCGAEVWGGGTGAVWECGPASKAGLEGYEI